MKIHFDNGSWVEVDDSEHNIEIIDQIRNESPICTACFECGDGFELISLVKYTHISV